MNIEQTLVLIPARGGSKGILDKNISILGDKPLIEYTVSYARQFFEDSHICVSTDSVKIIDELEKLKLKVPFIRPSELASDFSSTYEVIVHALEFYKEQGIYYKSVLLLQPTSPFRLEKHYDDMKDLFDESLDMVVSVGVSKLNPYFNLFEETNDQLIKSKPSNCTRRQDCPPCYFYNGSIYLINSKSLEEKSISEFSKVKKYVMDDKYSLDIDTPLDWAICETVLQTGILKM